MAAVSASIVATMSGFAYAQSTEPSVNLATSPIQQFGEAAAQHGIIFNSQYMGEAAANPYGGLQSGAEYTGQLNVGADAKPDIVATIDAETAAMRIIAPNMERSRSSFFMSLQPPLCRYCLGLINSGYVCTLQLIC